MAPDEQPSGRRRALLVATATYSDPALAALRAPTGDVAALAAVLGDSAVGGFEISELIDRPTEDLRREIETFFDEGRPRDLLLFYVSGHGVLSQSRRFYFATTDTSLALLRSTAIEDGFVNDVVQSSRARSIVLVLDCCHSGAFGKGLAPKSSTTVDVEHRFEGRGRVTLSASTELEYAFEETNVNPLDPAEPGSLFTRSVVDGLRSGEADIDEDGRITVDDLYDYVCRRVRERSVHQTPGMAGDVRGQIVIAQSPRRAALPTELSRAVGSNMAGIRAGAVSELSALLKAEGPVSSAARAALERLAEDDSRAVATAAASALGRPAPPERAPPKPPPRAAAGGFPRRNAVRVGVALAGLAAVVVLVVVLLPGGGNDSSGPSEGTAYDFQGNSTQQVLAAPMNASDKRVVIGPDATGDTQPIPVSAAAAGMPDLGDNQQFGTGIASGDFNGDGHADLAVGAASANLVGVRYGAGSGEFKGPAKLFTKKVSSHQFGYSLVARDLNDDNYGDLVIGAPGAGHDNGAIEILFGSGDGLSETGMIALEANKVNVGELPKGQPFSGFGSVLRTGNVDGDEYVDLVEGAPDGDPGHLTYCEGSAKGPTACRALAPLGGDNGTDALAVADLDDNDKDDIIQGDTHVGAGDAPGGVRVWPGGEQGPAVAPDRTVTPESLGLGAAFAASTARFGAAVDAGYVDSDDNVADFVVGAPGYKKNHGAIVLVSGASDEKVTPITDQGGGFGSDLAFLYLDSTDTNSLVVVADRAGLDKAVLVGKEDGAWTPVDLGSVGGNSRELHVGHLARTD